MTAKRRVIPTAEDVVVVDAGVAHASVLHQLARWWGDTAVKQIGNSNEPAARDAATNAVHYARQAEGL